MYAYSSIQARAIGCETVDVSREDPIPDQIHAILGTPEVRNSAECNTERVVTI